MRVKGVDTREQESGGLLRILPTTSVGRTRTQSQVRQFSLRKYAKPLMNAGRRHKDIREEMAWNEDKEGTVCLPKEPLLYLHCFTRGRWRGQL